jgi:hypothetical protein
MTDVTIIRVKRPDRYTTHRVSTLEPNRIPWNVYYIVTSTVFTELANLFKTAWVIFPSKNLSIIVKKEGTKEIEEYCDLLLHGKACIMVPTYVKHKKEYAYRYSRKSIKAKNTTLGQGLGKFYYLENGNFESPCLYCARSHYYLVGDCTPWTNSCLNNFWRGIERRP